MFTAETYLALVNAGHRQRHREKFFDLVMFFSASQRLSGRFIVFATLSKVIII